MMHSTPTLDLELYRIYRGFQKYKSPHKATVTVYNGKNNQHNAPISNLKIQYDILELYTRVFRWSGVYDGIWTLMTALVKSTQIPVLATYHMTSLIGQSAVWAISRHQCMGYHDIGTPAHVLNGIEVPIQDENQTHSTSGASQFFKFIPHNLGGIERDACIPSNLYGNLKLSRSRGDRAKVVSAM